MRQSPCCQRVRHLPKNSGQVLAEACIGLALLVFTWILLTFTSYMSNNHIRTLMASRHGAWLRGNAGGGSDLNGALRQQFFYEADQPLVEVSDQQAGLSIAGALTADGASAQATAPSGDGSWIVTVKFGMTPQSVTNTQQFPFTLMNTRVPFMTNSMLQNWLKVESRAAWPADCDETWEGFWTAIKEVVGLVLGELGGLLEQVLSHL